MIEGVAFLIVLALGAALVLSIEAGARHRRRVDFSARCRELQSRADGLNDYLETRGQIAYVDVTTDPPRLVVGKRDRNADGWQGRD